ncbi:MAG: ScyD/ScyE family protein [Thermomicrobiales bacterium]|nr:ScyD/ScyE family protein [Thermomicrobiales bacterium]
MTTRRSVLKGAVVAGAAAVPVLKGVSGTLAQDGATPEAQGGPPIPENCVLVAGGLNNPRGIAIAADGSIYVTEAGTGGDEELFEPSAATPDASPVPQTPFATRGPSGQVIKIAADGSATVVATGLTSYLIGGFEPNGPNGIALGDGVIYVSVGGLGPATGAVEPGETDGRIVSVDEASGAVTIVADLSAYEIENNPDPNAVDSNPYGITLGADGLIYAADAGANTVYSVDPATGEIAVVAVIPGIELPEEMQQEGGNPARGGAQEIDPVPTGVAVGANGDVFVSLLSGGPFPAGAAKIQKISGGTVSDVAGGLTMATDVAIGPDGHLYAVQISLNFLAETPDPGSVVRVLENGTLETVVEGLMLPNGLAFDDAGNLYITAGTVAPPGMGPVGMVLRCDGVAASA